MENLGTDELTQLVNFYRQRAADLELQVLQLQMKLNKALTDAAEHDHKTAPDKNKK